MASRAAGGTRADPATRRVTVIGQYLWHLPLSLRQVKRQREGDREEWLLPARLVPEAPSAAVWQAL